MTNRVLLVRPSGEQGRDHYHLADEDGTPVCGVTLQVYDDWLPIEPDHPLADQLEICGRCDPDHTIDRSSNARNGSNLSQLLADDRVGPEDVGLSPTRADHRTPALSRDDSRRGGVSR